MSTPVKTDKAVSIEEIVNDVRERGDAAVSRVVDAKFDATTSATPERAVAYGDIPTAAVLAAAEASGRGTRRNVPPT
jgi:histidinol dehydrogenase